VHPADPCKGLSSVSCLRLGEARNLELQDVDLKAGVLTVRSAKFGKTRLVGLQLIRIEPAEFCEPNALKSILPLVTAASARKIGVITKTNGFRNDDVFRVKASFNGPTESACSLTQWSLVPRQRRILPAGPIMTTGSH
jgi:hypothetical protein